MAHPKYVVFNPPWSLSAPCPCGFSSRPYGRCCRVNSAEPYVRFPSLQPPGPQTGYSNPRCFARSTCDCSEKISREHYVSRGVLDLMQTLSLSGVRWHAPGETRTYGVEALTAKILCKRHNEALAPLDSHAQRFAKAWLSAINHVSRPSRSERSEYHLVSGEAFERWLLKVFLGLLAGNIASSDHTPYNDKINLNIEPLVAALFGQGLQAPKGLYFAPHVGETTTNTTSFAHLRMDEQSNLYGLMANFYGYQWLLVTDEMGGEYQVKAMARLFRLQLADLKGPRRTGQIFMTWPAKVRSQMSITLKLGEAESLPDKASPLG